MKLTHGQIAQAVIACLILGGIGRLATKEMPSEATTTGKVATAEKLHGNLTVVGRITKMSPKESGMSLEIEGKDGFRVTCFCGPEIQLPNIHVGTKIKATGQQIEGMTGVVSIANSNNIQVLKDQMAISTWQATVRGGFAEFPNGNRLSTTLPDGYYPELLLVKVKGGWKLTKED